MTLAGAIIQNPTATRASSVEQARDKVIGPRRARSSSARTTCEPERNDGHHARNRQDCRGCLDPESGPQQDARDHNTAGSTEREGGVQRAGALSGRGLALKDAGVGQRERKADEQRSGTYFNQDRSQIQPEFSRRASQADSSVRRLRQRIRGDKDALHVGRGQPNERGRDEEADRADEPVRGARRVADDDAADSRARADAGQDHRKKK